MSSVPSLSLQAVDWRLRALSATPVVAGVDPIGIALATVLRPLLLDRAGQAGEIDLTQEALPGSPLEKPVEQLRQHVCAALCGVVSALAGRDPSLWTVAFELRGRARVLRRGDHLPLRTHPGGQWSCVFCVDPGDATRDHPLGRRIRLHPPVSSYTMWQDELNRSWGGAWALGAVDRELVEGGMLLFPSRTARELFQNDSARERVIVEFESGPMDLSMKET